MFNSRLIQDSGTADKTEAIASLRTMSSRWKIMESDKVTKFIIYPELCRSMYYAGERICILFGFCSAKKKLQGGWDEKAHAPSLTSNVVFIFFSIIMTVTHSAPAWDANEPCRHLPVYLCGANPPVHHQEHNPDKGLFWTWENVRAWSILWSTQRGLLGTSNNLSTFWSWKMIMLMQIWRAVCYLLLSWRLSNLWRRKGLISSEISGWMRQMWWESDSWNALRVLILTTIMSISSS